MTSQHWCSLGLYRDNALARLWAVGNNHTQSVHLALERHFEGRPFTLAEADRMLESLAAGASFRDAAGGALLKRQAPLAPLAQYAYLERSGLGFQHLFSGHEGMGLDCMAHPPAAFLGHQLNVAQYHADRTQMVWVKTWPKGQSELVCRVDTADNVTELIVRTSVRGGAEAVLDADQESGQRLVRRIGNRNREMLSQLRAFAEQSGLV